MQTTRSRSKSQRSCLRRVGVGKLVSTIVLWLIALPAGASAFIDPQDGMPDLSEWLLDRRGFLPVPIVITEPAVGYGGGLALMFVSQSLRESAHADGHVTPPNIYGVAAFRTENGTQGGGLGGMMSFDEDRWRYRGGIAKIDAELDFYGIGVASDLKLGFNIEGWMSSQQLLRRLGRSDVYLGLRWLYFDLDTRFDPQRDESRLPSGKALAKRNSGIGVSLEYDSRDSIFTPSRGWTGVIEGHFYDPDWGADNRMQSYRAHLFSYWQVARPLVLGVRADARAARGDIPFYQAPFIDMRGIPAFRYQGENTALLETELRWNVTPRWALIGFVGAGRAWSENERFGEAGSVVGRGAGFRYLLARRLGLYVGLDYGEGPDDHAWYVQIGSAWR